MIYSHFYPGSGELVNAAKGHNHFHLIREYTLCGQLKQMVHIVTAELQSVTGTKKWKANVGISFFGLPKRRPDEIYQAEDISSRAAFRVVLAWWMLSETFITVLVLFWIPSAKETCHYDAVQDPGNSR